MSSSAVCCIGLSTTGGSATACISKWYTNGVGEAISKCRREQALFIVYIQDSTSSSEVWDNSEIQSVMKVNKFVALKVLQDSIEYRQFSQLYPVFVIPSVFFIGRRGTVLEMVSGPMEAGLLKEKLQKAFEKLGAEVAPQATPPATTSEATPPATAVASPTSGGGEAKARYQDKIGERRREKAVEEIQKEKEQELKRREDLKTLAKVKEQQEQVKLQTWMNERAKEKDMTRRAKEEVKAKLEMDRLERQGSLRNSGVENDEGDGPSLGGGGSLPGGGVMRQRLPVLSSPPSPSSSTSESCRVQLKLPEGRTSVKVMRCSDTLGDLRRLVAQDLGVGEGKVLLSSVYPRRDLTNDVDCQTMQDLQLVPSGVVIVRMKGGMMMTAVGGEGGGVVSTLWGGLIGLFQLLLSLFAFLRKALGRMVSGGTTTPPTGSQQRSAVASDLRVRRFRQEDYHDDPDDEDEKRRRDTYNGNSTQQQ